jgi:predicted phage terminase large subunit-like protein
VRRRAGEALHPEREPLEVLENLRRTLGEYNFAGQYQQEPAPLGGGMVKAESFRSYVPGEEPSRFDRILQSWDTANKSSELNDYSVCTTWGLKNKKIYLLHVLRRRMDYPDLKRAVRELAERFHPANILIEDKASGTQLIQELIRDNVYSVTRYEPTMDKVMRLHWITCTIKNGFVYLPTESDWLAAYVHELTTFPSSKHDDQADSTSQALDWLIQNNPLYGVLERRRQELLAEKLGLPRDFDFTQCDEGEEILAANKTTGQKIRWTGQAWVDASSNTSVAQSETCPSCGASGAVTLRYSDQKRCQQCGKQWPPISRGQPILTRREVLSGTEF